MSADFWQDEVYALIVGIVVAFVLPALAAYFILQTRSSPLPREQIGSRDLDSLKAIESFLLQCPGTEDDIYAVIGDHREEQNDQAFSVALLTQKSAADLDGLWSTVQDCSSEYVSESCGRVDRQVAVLQHPFSAGNLQAALMSKIKSCGSLESCVIEIQGCENLSTADVAPLLAALDRHGALMDMGKRVSTAKLVFLLVFDVPVSGGSSGFGDHTTGGENSRAYLRESLMVNLEKNKGSGGTQSSHDSVSLVAMLRRIQHIMVC